MAAATMGGRRQNPAGLPEWGGNERVFPRYSSRFPTLLRPQKVLRKPRWRAWMGLPAPTGLPCRRRRRLT
jgi:hypothetical protein